MRAMRTLGHEPLLVVAILMLATLLRIVAAIVLPDQSSLLPDAASYRELAQILRATGQVGGPFFQMPLYPLLIAITGPGIGQLVADIALSVAIVLLVFALARTVLASTAAAFLAAAAAACYPPLIFFAVVGLSETLFIAMMLAAFLCWYRGWFAAAAVFAVLTILTRPIFDLAAPFLVVTFAILVHRQSLGRAALRLVQYLVIYCALMIPWWINNYRVYGTFVRLTPNLGTVLYAGNNPLNTSGGGNLGVDYDLRDFSGIQDPVARDRALRDAALDFMIHNPGRVAALALKKFVRMWRPWPVNEGYSSRATVLVALVSFVPVLLLGLCGIIAMRTHLSRLAPILLFAAGYTAINMLLVGTIRYRLPLEPFLLMFAGASVQRLLSRASPRAALLLSSRRAA